MCEREREREREKVCVRESVCACTYSSSFLKDVVYINLPRVKTRESFGYLYTLLSAFEAFSVC